MESIVMLEVMRVGPAAPLLVKGRGVQLQNENGVASYTLHLPASVERVRVRVAGVERRVLGAPGEGEYTRWGR